MYARHQTEAPTDVFEVCVKASPSHILIGEKRGGAITKYN